MEERSGGAEGSGRETGVMEHRLAEEAGVVEQKGVEKRDRSDGA